MAKKKTEEKKPTKKAAKPIAPPAAAPELELELYKRLEEIEKLAKTIVAIRNEICKSVDDAIDRIDAFKRNGEAVLLAHDKAISELASQVATLRSGTVTPATAPKPSKAAVRAAPGSSYRKLLQEIRAKRNTPPAATEPEK